MRISVVIPAYNAEETIGKAVAAALAQGDGQGRGQGDAPEVIVVDDGSTDGTPDAAKAHPVKYIRQKNAGPATARNTGWKAATGDIVAFTDSDCVPVPGWLDALKAGFTDAAVGAVTGSYSMANPGRLLPNLIHEEIKDRHTGYDKTVKFFGSYNVAIRRGVLEETGGFDEGYRRASGEDNDLSYRVLAAGYKIAFAPGALVGHYHTTSLIKYLKEQYTHGYWRMKLYRAHPGMAGGDDYTRIKDVAEPPLALASLLSAALLPVMPGFFGLLAAALALMQAPAALRVAARRGRPELMALAPVTFLRGYARGLGMLSGFVRFYMRGER